ncbi:hypothetical protein [Kitasatospora sp. NPDC018619]|uniref:hypothetical protein n=1 Tax=unclassified Kitasatospora TaxID=2633591 RepID=UPI00379C0A05
MSDHGDTTWIGRTQGQTHTGSGDQYSYSYYYFASDRLVRSGGDPLRLAAERRRWLSQRFVEPRGYAEVFHRLEEPGTAVLISGHRGSGRRTAAVVVLHRAGRAGDPFREVALDDQQAEPGELAEGERVLIDLSDLSDQQFADAQGLVTSYWHKVERQSGRLAVVLSREQERLLPSDVRQLLVPVDRPAGDRVLAKHLWWADVRVPAPELRRSALGEFLDRSPMRELERLHELVVEARMAGGTFEAWAATAAAALRKRGEEVAQLVAGLTDGRQRALLFTAAMMDGAPAAAAFRLADQLLARVGHPEDDRPRLDRADLTQRVRELGMTVRDGRIRFEELAYAEAVREHFWLYYPDLREAFAAWVDDSVKATALLSAVERRRLVARFTGEALNAGDVGLLADSVTAWAKESRFLPEAMLVLEQGITSETCGPAFRAKVYEWSVGPQPHANLVRVLARICVDVMATHHPDQALVRLHHLARREPGDGPRYGREALLELVGRDERLYLRLLDRSCEGLEKSPPVPSDGGIFLALMDPLSDRVRQEEAVRGWRAVVRVPSLRTEWEPVVRNWLSAARQAEDGGERLMTILLRAAEGRGDVLHRYYLLALDWAADAEDSVGRVSREEVASRFQSAIDRLQGIEPLVGAAGGRGL